jgi:hypothetical protein
MDVILTALTEVLKVRRNKPPFLLANLPVSAVLQDLPRLLQAHNPV